MRVTISLFLAAITAGCAVQAQSLSASPSTVSISYQSGNALPSAQSVSVRATGAGAPTAYSVSVTPASAQWLTATPDSGKLPASLSIRANPTSLPAGVYTASVVVTGGSLTVSIPVSLTVTNPLPKLALSATTLTFTTPPNPPPAQTIVLSTNGAPVPFTAAASGTWLQVSPTSGVVLPGSEVTLTVSVDATGLDPAATAYTGKVTIVGTGVQASSKSQNVTVSLTAKSSTPTITSLWPSSAQVNAPPTTITVRGTGFYKGTTMKVSGVTTPLATMVLSPTALQAVIPQNLLASAGSLDLIASNPAPGGDSAPSPFTVSATPVVQAAVNVASYALAPVAPGELISLFGSGIGPQTPVGLQDDGNGFVSTSSGGITVTIDNQTAPIIYASQDQISVQVPYNVSHGTGKSIAVINGSTTATGTVDIGTVGPGIFTLDGSGVGQAAALNFKNGTYVVNGSSAPAKAGDTVVIYVTGEGDYAAAEIPIETGYLVPLTLNPLPQVSPVPAVTIGGAAATVSYAGPLPGSILGLLQLNVVVPTGSATGKAVPLTVTIAGVAAQSGVTLVVSP